MYVVCKHKRLSRGTPIPHQKHRVLLPTYLPTTHLHTHLPTYLPNQRIWPHEPRHLGLDLVIVRKLILYEKRVSFTRALTVEV